MIDVSATATCDWCDYEQEVDIEPTEALAPKETWIVSDELPSDWIKCSLEIGGENYHFCCKTCKAAYEKEYDVVLLEE